MTLNINTLSIALPTVAKRLGANALESSWLMLSYTVTMAALLLGAGRLSNLVDHRRLYLTGIAIFLVTALLVGGAPDVQTLIALRVAMAIGGAILTAGSAVIIHAAFPPPGSVGQSGCTPPPSRWRACLARSSGV